MNEKAETSATLKRKLRLKLAKLGQEHPFVAGSLTKIHRRCGNPDCRCAREEGGRHPAHLLTAKVKGKTRSVYVPVDMVEEVGQWCRRYRDLKADIQEISACCGQLIRLHAKEKRAVAGKRRGPAEA
jgi:hypothetical protein